MAEVQLVRSSVSVNFLPRLVARRDRVARVAREKILGAQTVVKVVFARCFVFFDEIQEHFAENATGRPYVYALVVVWLAQNELRGSVESRADTAG